MKRQLSLALCITALSSTAVAEVYQWVDQNGRRHYSDRPHAGSEVVDIDPGHAYYRVKRVFDGDTVLLENGQKVRFLGVNTPEVEGRNKAAEPGGIEAKRWLESQLRGRKVWLQAGVEKQDKYGRLLAHVFTDEGVHLNLELVKNGLATVNIHPPNLRYSDEFLAQEALAEDKKLGIWADPQYQATPFDEIRDSRGWKRVVGVVMGIKETRKYVYLQFSKDFSIKIKKADRALFQDWRSYRGKRIEARGWLNKSKRAYMMSVRHPGALKFL